MKKLFYFFVALLAVACSSGPDPGEVAAQAAKEYYTQLLAGKYEHYVDGFYRPDSIPASYRRQLIDNAKMFVGQQKDERRGILDVRVVNAVADTTKRSANVFLIFAYGDSTSEEVVVPMVQHRGVWYMR
ncbi:hypothetical protein [Hoylesella loescheii]|jgi:hypothetical protein|uniref:hypothetical protein n=1 Tax=Hoylesella loescheii TaxID=840 RepID=UPI000F1604C8|nr:hypothetical protein [Hoylesella loescheii]RKW59943.1 MAG: hypothetical protein D8H98_07935 [Prevotella sp.]